MTLNWTTTSAYADQHFLITPSDDDLLQDGLVILANGEGTITIADKVGTEITYNVLAGQIIPVVAYKVLETGTTVDSIVGLL